MQMVLKCADIGHLAAEPSTHTRWAFQLEEEFFRQVHTYVLHDYHHTPSSPLLAFLLVNKGRFSHSQSFTTTLAGPHPPTLPCFPTALPHCSSVRE